MKRDMELVRKMLLEIEGTRTGSVYDTSTSKLSAWSQDALDEHLLLLHQAGFVTNYQASGEGGMCTALSWQGHDFLDTIRSEPVWRETKRRLGEKGITASIEVIKSLAESVAKQVLDPDAGPGG